MKTVLKLKKVAFTLAEILITLAIIGVVAALTIPALIANQEKQKAVSQVLKYQSVLQNAVNQYMYNNNTLGNLTGGIFNNGATGVSQKMWDGLKPNLRLLKDCGINVNQNCIGIGYKAINGSTTYGVIDKNPDASNAYAKGILADGSSIGMADYPGDCATDRSTSGTGPKTKTCGYLTIDTNGWNNPPNQWGHDYFTWGITSDGIVRPGGTYEEMYGGCDKKSSDVTGGANGAPGWGMGCAAEVIEKKAIDYY